MRRVLEGINGAGWRAWAAAGALVVIAGAPWWGPRLLSHLSYFQLRRIEVHGQQYLAPRDLLERLGVDTTMSVWTDLRPLERRVAAHPQVRAVHIERKLPGTLVVYITENLPVAFVPWPERGTSIRPLRPVDANGRVLPINPGRVHVDLPVLPAPDAALLRLLGEVRSRTPSLFDQISSARRVGRDEVAITLAALVVRAPAGVTAERLADIIPVENDLARRRVRVAELDLRFRDQVIARLQ